MGGIITKRSRVGRTNPTQGKLNKFTEDNKFEILHNQLKGHK